MARRLAEGLSILEGDDRARTIVNDMEHSSMIPTSAICVFAAATLFRVGGKFVGAAERLERRVVFPSGRKDDPPAIRKSSAVQVALIVDSSMIPRRVSATDPTSDMFDPSQKLVLYANMEFEPVEDVFSIKTRTIEHVRYRRRHRHGPGVERREGDAVVRARMWDNDQHHQLVRQRLRS